MLNLRIIFQKEHDRLILFAPFCMALGIISYFSLPYEPPAFIGCAALLASIGIVYATRLTYLRYVCIAFMLAALGFTLAQWRTASMDVVALTSPMPFARVTGTLESIEQTPKGSKLYLNKVVIEGLAKEGTPARITLTLRSYDDSLRNGQSVSLLAGLFPPPQAALPGGFDFARHYYFKAIGAVGYGMPPVTVNATPEQSSFAIGFSELRHRVTQSIRAHFDEPAGSIAAAFVTGQTASIPESVNEDMRIAGIYHLLAVSGLNLSIVAGIAFFTVRLLLAAIPALALRYNIKKWAAAAALVFSFLYLQLAGSPVSAERAFLMVSLIFIAIMLDRDPSPMRAIAAAAVIIMCFTPEAVLTASFQLSFSATTAIVAAYESIMGQLRKRATGIGIQRLVVYFYAVAGTALVAWVGTEPFIIYHFHQFSTYSLLTNTLAEPLVSFVLMPLVVLGVALLPLGLGFIAFTPMQYALDMLNTLAHWVASLPHAMLLVPAPTDLGFFVIACGLVWLYFWRGWIRLLGLPFIAAGFFTCLYYETPDLLISGDGKQVAVRMEDGSAFMLKGRAGSFVAEQWSRAMLVQDMENRKASPANCDKQGCLITLHGHSIALPKTQEAAMEDCTQADIVIVTGFAIAQGACHAKLVIDDAALSANGATALHFGQGGIRIAHARTLQGARPWQSIALPSDPTP